MRPWLLVPVLAVLAACSGGEAAGGRGGPPLVKAEPVGRARFVERIDAVGTALANEQVVLAAPVTDRITSLNFTDGGYVRQGQVIAVLAQGQESAQLAEAGATATEAQKQLDRLQALKARGFATNSAVDSQVALAAQARAQAAGARASIGDRVIRAPFSGRLSLRNISRGAVVSAGTEIATVSDVSVIKLDFPVPETLLCWVREGQTIEAIAAAYPDRRFAGTVRSIDSVVDPNTRAVTIRAIVPNPDGALKPGMLMTVAVESRAREALAVPELALVGEGDRSFVYVLNGETVKRTPVRTGARQNGLVEVVSGLRPNARIVTEGVVKLSDGMKVSLGGGRGGGGARGR